MKREKWDALKGNTYTANKEFPGHFGYWIELGSIELGMKNGKSVPVMGMA